MVLREILVICIFLGIEGNTSHPSSEDEEEQMILGVETLKALQQKHTETDLVSVNELHSMLQKNDVRLIDVRNPNKLKEEGKIGQSVNIPLREIDSALKLSDDEFKSKYEMMKPEKEDCNLVFHCTGGEEGSLQAVKIAKSNGYKCPKSLKGGFVAWKIMSETGQFTTDE